MIIQAREVYKSFKNVDAVKGISLSIAQGQFVALLGPNGAGKTTMVEMIEGIQKPDKGEILISGKTWKGNEDELHHLIGLSLQETHFIDKLTVQETLRLFASFYGEKKARVTEVIQLINLEEKRKSYVVNLSGGQRQRLALGIALLNHPKVLILDEPTTGLDPNARRDIWRILLELKKQSNTSLLLTTHYMEEAEQLCDYIIIMNNGSILKEGTLDQLLNDENGSKTVEFTLEGIYDSIDDDEAFSEIRWNNNTQQGTVYLNDIEKDMISFLALLEKNNLHLKNLEIRRKSLDDLFTSLTGRHLDE
ncbi:MAG: ABC transporter ATP-binding protein [Bacteroidetes bacterium]|nr:ABC transporter ATP-binding protein [Bacteroidota bacterium]